jgi:hypothetical protein
MSPMTPYERANWQRVPLHFRAELDAYIAKGIVPDSRPLRAILSNNLAEAVLLCNPIECFCTVLFLHNFCPSIAWGSGERMAEWEKVGGLEGALVH